MAYNFSFDAEKNALLKLTRGIRFEDIIALIDDDTACVVVQQPDVFGHVRDLNGLADAVHARGALLIVSVADPTSLGLLKSPGAWGADIATAEGQPLGLPLQFGGPCSQ